MTLLYKKTNLLWPLLIRYRLTHAAWRPLVELARCRNLAWRRTLEAGACRIGPVASSEEWIAGR
jgi:hypothetical protein